MAQPTHYTVTSSFVGALGGHEVEYQAGEVVEASDPAVKKMPLHFAPLIVRDHADHRTATIEQATAAPGEKRSLIHRKKPRKATAAEEAGVKAAVEAEAAADTLAETEAPDEPAGKPITTASWKGR